MKTSIVAYCLAIAGLAAAQTPEGFSPSVATHLDVTFGGKAVLPAGTSLAKAGVSSSGRYNQSSCTDRTRHCKAANDWLRRRQRHRDVPV